ncbi:MAG: phasin family protein [Proteobacteria bacterium]|nr:phasin family protein [Pseudomonadota bacterium]
MTNLYNTKQTQESWDFFNEAAKSSINDSVTLWEQNVAFVRANMERNVSRLFSLPKFSSAEEALSFQKETSETELSELQKAGQTYYALASNAGQNFLSVAQKGRTLVENSFSEALEQSTQLFPNQKTAEFSDVVRNSVQTANDFFQKNFDVAVQATRAGADNVVNSQPVVASKKKASKK